MDDSSHILKNFHHVELRMKNGTEIYFLHNKYYISLKQKELNLFHFLHCIRIISTSTLDK